jgi:glycosyltransferase
MPTPQISIITATFNAASTIADCLTSVNSQTILVEHIIIDGSSTDNTLDIVRNISPYTRILSEPDNGIYDAMNKGIGLATGEIIGILNADDFYASPDVLAHVAKVFSDPFVDACYGDLLYVAETQSPLANQQKIATFKTIRYWKSGAFNPDQFYRGWMPPHPTFFVRRRLYDQFGLFNLNLGSAADYELMLRFLLKHKAATVYIPEILVKMRTGGASNANISNRIKANQMDRQAWEVNDLKPYPWTLYLKPLRKLSQWIVRP